MSVRYSPYGVSYSPLSPKRKSNTTGTAGGGMGGTFATSPSTDGNYYNAPTDVPAPPEAAPAPPPPPPAPFATAGDLANYADALKTKGDQGAQLDKDLADLQAQSKTALYNIGQNYVKGVSSSQDNAAARGIFQSSIKDSALADLAATKATMQSDVNTRVNNAALFHDQAMKRLNDWWNSFNDAFNAKKVENAAALT